MAHSPKRGNKLQSGVRSPTAHRTLEQASSHWQEYGSKHKDDNRARVAARYQLEKDGKVRAGDGKDVDHKRALSKGGGNTKGNLRVTSAKRNRARNFSRGDGG
jgi:hypothetical protein